jgi:hypothetical protein
MSLAHVMRQTRGVGDEECGDCLMSWLPKYISPQPARHPRANAREKSIGHNASVRDRLGFVDELLGLRLNQARLVLAVRAASTICALPPSTASWSHDRVKQQSASTSTKHFTFPLLYHIVIAGQKFIQPPLAQGGADMNGPEILHLIRHELQHAVGRCGKPSIPRPLDASPWVTVVTVRDLTVIVRGQRLSPWGCPSQTAARPRSSQLGGDPPIAGGNQRDRWVRLRSLAEREGCAQARRCDGRPLAG